MIRTELSRRQDAVTSLLTKSTDPIDVEIADLFLYFISNDESNSVLRELRYRTLIYQPLLARANLFISATKQEDMPKVYECVREGQEFMRTIVEIIKKLK